MKEKIKNVIITNIWLLFCKLYVQNAYVKFPDFHYKADLFMNKFFVCSCCICILFKPLKSGFSHIYYSYE